MPLQLASIPSLWPSPSSCHPYGLCLQLWFSFLLLRALAITFASPGYSRIISSPQVCDLTPSAGSLLLYRLTNSLASGLEHEHFGRSFCLLQSTPVPKIHIPPWKVLKSFDPLQHQLKRAVLPGSHELRCPESHLSHVNQVWVNIWHEWFLGHSFSPSVNLENQLYNCNRHRITVKKHSCLRKLENGVETGAASAKHFIRSASYSRLQGLETAFCDSQQPF